MKVQLRLRELRQARGWSLAHAACKVGTSVPHLSQLERGVKRINNDWLNRFSSLYGVPVTALFADQESAEAAALLVGLEQLSPEDLRRVRMFAEALAHSATKDGQEK